MDIFEILFYQPVYNLTIVLYRLFAENLGLAIIAIGILSRVIMIPMTLKQTRMAQSSKEFNEKAKEIKRKYKNDKQQLQAEMIKLQQEYLPAQLAGCLPLILQLILFINIYNVIRNIIDTGAEGFNNIAYGFVEKFPEGFHINTNFLNIFDLKVAPSNVDGQKAIAYLLLVIAVGITQYFSVKVISGLRNADKAKETAKKDEKAPEDFGEIMQRSSRQVMFIMPVLLMLIAYSLPSGLGIYLITTSTFVILQQVIYYRYFKKDEDNSSKIQDKVIEGEIVSSESKNKDKKKKSKKKKKNKRR